MSIETKNFIATPTDIEKLAADIIDGVQRSETGRGTYLRALVATTQAQLQSPVRQRTVKMAKLSPDDMITHLKAFNTIAQTFYGVVLQVAKATVPDPDTKLIRQRTGFARSAASTVRGFIRAGNDVRALAAHRVTKSGLASPLRKRKPTPDVLKRRAVTAGSGLEKIARELYALNPQEAHDVLGPMITKLVKAAGLAQHATKDPQEAQADGRPWTAKGSVFVPFAIN